MSEKVEVLNKILAEIDSRATSFKEKRHTLREAQHFAEKKLLLDLISQALTLAQQIVPQPTETIRDLRTLEKQFMDMR